MIQLAGWIIVTGMAAVLVTQAVGRTPIPIIFVAQALTPYMLPVAVVLVVAAAGAGWFPLSVAAGVVAAAVLRLVAPVAARARGHFEPLPPGGVTFSLAHANVYVDNPRPAEVGRALAGLDADLIAVTEYIGPVRDAMVAGGIGTTHPHRIERASSDRDGIALFSRHPMVGDAVSIGHQLGIDATVDCDGARIRVMVVHPLPGTKRRWLRRWRDDLASIGHRASRAETPTLVVGDFNASRWHPPFRRLLDGDLSDAHEQLGRGLSVSWPLNKIVPPPFVRLDHALTTPDLVATQITDITVPGSDHRAFVVTIGLAATDGSPPSQRFDQRGERAAPM